MESTLSQRKEWFRFSNPTTERAYQDQTSQKYGWMPAALAVFGIFGFASYGQFDSYSTAHEQLRLVRFGLVVPLLTVMAILGLIKKLRPYWQWQMLASCQIAHLGAIWLYCYYQGTSPYGFGTTDYALNMVVLLVGGVMIPPISTLKVLVSALSIAASYAVIEILVVGGPDNVRFGLVFNIAYISLCCALVAAWRDVTFRSLFRERMNVSNERNLLSVILAEIVPTDVAISIKQGHKVPTKSFGEVAILFADLVGFTKLSARIGPKHLVEILDRLFTRFDDLVEALALEKVKTIGDAYMVVGGAKEDREDMLGDTVTLGWQMIAETHRIAAETGLPIEMRIGVNVGSVIGGVIGRTRMTFDYWGDAVNLASRMEANGIPGRIQISEAAFLRLNGRYVVEQTRKVTLKGMGEVECYVLAPQSNEKSPAVVKPVTR